jgi:hypothetical protein
MAGRQRFNRKAERYYDSDPSMARVEVDVPASTSKASRPDLYPAFAQGCASASPNYGTAGGNNLQDTNTDSEHRVSISGAATKSQSKRARGGAATRLSPGSLKR